MQQEEFWGIHRKGDRIEIDTERYLTANRQITTKEFIPDVLKKYDFSRYYIPERIQCHDYFSNFMKDSLNGFLNDRNNEYKPIFKQITTLEQIQDSSSSANIPFMGCSEDYEDAVMQSRWDVLKRWGEYEYTLNELQCAFISKLCVIMDWALLSELSDFRYDFDEFNMIYLFKFIKQKITKLIFIALKGLIPLTDCTKSIIS